MNNKNLSLIIFIVIVLAVAAGAFYFGLKRGEEMGYKKGYDEGVKATEASYKKLMEKTAPPVVNPAENLPTTNPFEEVKVNPFEGIYKNPFK